MPARKRNFLTREKDLIEVSRLYCQGLSQMEIAKKLDLSQQQISFDLKSIRDEWSKQRTSHFDALIDRELLRIDNLEREAWRAWEQSKHPKETRRAKQTVGHLANETNEVSQKETSGDPRFLVIVQSCIQDRLRLLGLNAPQVKELRGVIDHRHTVDVQALESEQRTEAILQLARRTGAFQVLQANNPSATQSDDGVIDVEPAES